MPPSDVIWNVSPAVGVGAGAAATSRTTPSVLAPELCRMRVKLVGQPVMNEWYEAPQPESELSVEPASDACAGVRMRTSSPPELVDVNAPIGDRKSRLRRPHSPVTYSAVPPPAESQLNIVRMNVCAPAGRWHPGSSADTYTRPLT